MGCTPSNDGLGAGQDPSFPHEEKGKVDGVGQFDSDGRAGDEIQARKSLELQADVRGCGSAADRVWDVKSWGTLRKV